MTDEALHAATEHFESHRENYLEDLKELVRIPGVPFKGFPHEEVVRSAEATKGLLERRGFENVRLLEAADAPPAVFGEIRAGKKDAPTLLLYAHHDVQPAGDPAEWTSPPFEPTIRDGRLFGRGAVDDKGGLLAHVAAAESWRVGAGAPPLHVKLFVEGEEEVGSAHLNDFLKRHGSLLAADAVAIVDTQNLDAGIPSLTTALRGLVAMDVEVRTMRQALHSGMWGGPIPDPATALAKMIASLTDDAGRIAVPGVEETAAPLTDVQRKGLEEIPLSTDDFRGQVRMLEGTELLVDKEQNPFERLWYRPSLVVNAMQASSRADARNIVCDAAWARIGVRLAPGMDPKKTEEAIAAQLHANAPWGVEVTITPEASVGAWTADPDHPALAAGLRALESGYGREALAIGCGGSIPVVETFARALGAPPVLMLGLADPTSNPHGPDESLNLADWDRTARSMIHLFAELAEAPAGRGSSAASVKR